MDKGRAVAVPHRHVADSFSPAALGQGTRACDVQEGRPERRKWAWAGLELLVLGLTAPLLLFPQRLGWPLALAGTAGLVVMRIAASRGQVARSTAPLGLPVGVLLGMACLGTGISADWSYSQHKLFGIVFGLAACLTMTSVVTRLGPAGDRLGSALLVAQGTAVAILGLLGTEWTVGRLPWLDTAYTHLPRLLTSVETSTGTTAGLHPAEVGGILVLLWPVSLAPLVWRGWSRPAWCGYAIAAAIMAGMLFLSASRSAYLGAVAALLVLGWLRAPRITALAGAVGLGVVAYLLLSQVLGSATHVLWAGDPAAATTGTGLSWRSRIEIWQRALSMVQDFPLTGIGLNTFPLVVDAMYPLTLDGHLRRVPHAHNLYLQTAVDLGLPGLAAWLWIVVTVVRSWFKAWHHHRPGAVRLATPDGSVDRATALRQGSLAALLAGLIGHLAFGLTDAVTLGAKPGYLLWMVMGIILGLASLTPYQRPRSTVEPVPQGRK